MKRFFVLMALLTMIFTSLLPARAQDATPAAGGCMVAPMPEDRIQELAARAATPSVPVTETPVDLSEGVPVSDEMRAELSVVIRQTEICAQEQDLARLLSLFSDRFIVQQFFASEPVQIVATDKGTPTSATIPAGATDQENMLMDAVLLPDGRVAANVSSNAWGGDQRLYLFVQQDGGWKIDQIGTGPGTFSVGGTNQVTIPVEAQAVVDLVLSDASAKLGVDPSALSVTAVEAVDWPDSSLGCPQPDGVYAQVISPGYRIIVTDGSQTLEYHTGLNDAFVACAG